MSRLPDLAIDSLLYTHPSDFSTTHSFPEIDEAGRRSYRTELWKHERFLGDRREVRLEKCVSTGPNQGSLRAVRMIKKQSRPRGILDFGRELEAIAKFSNKRYRSWFVRSSGWYEDSSSIFVAMEFCAFGDLHYHLSTRRSLPVTETQQLTWQILEALHQMHENNFVHSDLRPKNILIKSMPPNNNWWVVLADFGISTRADQTDEPSTEDGFRAPELPELGSKDAAQYPAGSKAADMWALGEIVVRMLTGEPTFRSLRTLMQYCAGEPFPFDRLSLSLTSNGKDFISNLMAVNPRNRLSTSQCIEHPWINSQRTSRADDLAVKATAQKSPIELPHPDIFPTTSRTGVSTSGSAVAQPKAPPEPVNPWDSHQTGSLDAGDKQLYLTLSVPSEGKQVHMRPAAETEEKEVCPSLSAEAEGKQVLPTPRAESEEKQVLQNASIFRNRGIVQESPFVAKLALQTLDSHTRAVNTIAFSPDGGLMASVSDDRTIKLWDGQFRSEPQTLRAHKFAVNAVAFSPDGKTLVSSSAATEGSMKLWDCSSGTQLETLNFHTGAVSALNFSPDGETLATSSILDEGKIRLWDSKTGALRKSLIGHYLNVNTVTFSPDGQTLASASHDGYVKTWDAQSGKTLRTMWGYSQWVTAVALEPSGIRAVSHSPDGIRDIAYSPDGKTLASASDDGTIRLWDSRSGAALKTLKRQWRWATVSPVGINTVKFSPGGTILASGSDDGIIKLWDMRTGAVLQTLKAHSKWISALAFSPEGKILASASHDSTIRLWS